MEQVSKACISCIYWREAFSPPPVLQAPRQRAQTDSPRHCPGAACPETHLETSPGCRSQLSVSSTWPCAWPSGGKPPVCPRALSQLSQMLPAHSTALLQLPTSRTELPSVTRRQGREKARSACLANPPQAQCYCMMFVPMQAVRFKKPGAF